MDNNEVKTWTSFGQFWWGVRHDPIDNRNLLNLDTKVIRDKRVIRDGIIYLVNDKVSDCPQWSSLTETPASTQERNDTQLEDVIEVQDCLK